MGTRAWALTACACALLLSAACHGPPIMSRIQPRVTAPTRAAPALAPRARRADPLKAPQFLEREGRPESVITDAMIDKIEKAVLLRQQAKRKAAQGPCPLIDEARRFGKDGKVGQEERGCIAIPIPCPPEIVRWIGKKLSK